MPEQWRRLRAPGGRLEAAVEARRETLGDRSYLGGEYPRATPRAARTDAWPPSGDPPASDLPFMREQLLDRYGIEYGVLTPMLGAGEQLDLERGAALASAINDWQTAEWLDPEPRLRASINVAYEDGELSAREIHRVASDPRFVQVLMLIRTAEPLGRRKYWKIYEAAVEHDLPVGVHFGGWGRGPITGVGYPLVLHRGHGWDGDGVRRPAHEPRLRGRVRALPEPADRADRGRDRVARAADVAAGPGVAAAARRGAASDAPAVGADPRARVADHAADRRAAPGRPTSPRCSSRSG